MPNVWLPIDGSGIRSETLGDLTTPKVRILINNLTWASRGGYLFGQAVADPARREFAFRASSSLDQVYFISGGNSHSLGTFENAFGVPTGQTLSNATLDVTLDVNGDITVIVDGVTTYTGTMTRGTQRVDNILFRFGSRSNGNARDNTHVDTLSAGDKYGDVDVFVSDVLVRSLTMPADNNSPIVDSVDLTDPPLIVEVVNGDGTDFEAVNAGPTVTTRRVTFDIPTEIQALGSIRYFINRLDTGVQIETGTQDFNTATLEFNFDAVDTITNNLALSLTATDADGSNDNTAGVMFGTALAVVATS